MKFPSFSLDIFKRSASPSLFGRHRSSTRRHSRSSSSTAKRAHRRRKENSYRSATKPKFYPVEHFAAKHRSHHGPRPEEAVRPLHSAWHLQPKPLAANDAQRLCYYTSSADVYEISNAKFYDYNANGVAIDHSVNDMNAARQYGKECVGVPVPPSNSHFYVNLRPDQQLAYNNKHAVSAHQSSHLAPTQPPNHGGKWIYGSDNHNSNFVNCVNSIGPLIQSTAIGRKIERHRRRKVIERQLSAFPQLPSASQEFPGLSFGSETYPAARGSRIAGQTYSHVPALTNKGPFKTRITLNTQIEEPRRREPVLRLGSKCRSGEWKRKARSVLKASCVRAQAALCVQLHKSARVRSDSARHRTDAAHTC